MAQQGGGGLPTAYQAVEYLESTGTQWIDTGYYPNINTEFYVDFSDWGSTGTVYCTPGGISHTGVHVGLYTNNQGFRVYTSFGDKYDIGYINNSYLWLNRTKITIGKTGVVQNGEQVLTYTNVTFGEPPYSMVLFARRNGTSGEVERFASMKLYESIVSESGLEVRHFLPCVRKSDNKPGMYDTVSKTFYTNAGTGEFVVPN